MQRSLKAMGIAVLMCLLIACTTNPYPEVMSSQPHAVVYAEPSGDWREAIGGTKAGIRMINGQKVSTASKAYGAKRRIATGKTELVVQSYLSTRLDAFAVLRFEAKVGKSYRLTNEDEGDHVLFRLIDDATGQVVAQGAGEKVLAPQGSTLYIPIVH